MLYRITNISNTKLSLEPPSLLSPGKSILREYAPDDFPKRIQTFKKHSMIDVCPLVPDNTAVQRKKTQAQLRQEAEQRRAERKRLQNQLPPILPPPSPAQPEVESSVVELPELPPMEMSAMANIPSIEVLDVKELSEKLEVKLKNKKPVVITPEEASLLDQIRAGKVLLSKEELESELRKIKRPQLIKLGAASGITGALKYGKDALIERILAAVTTVEKEEVKVEESAEDSSEDSE